MTYPATLTMRQQTAPVALSASACVTVEAGFWWFGYGYFSQEPGCL